MSTSGIISIIVVVVILVLFIILISYIKAPPQIAYIISGLSKQPRTYIGKGGIRIPFFERLDKVFLGQVTVDVKTSRSVPTNDFINVRVDAVTKLRVIPSPEGIRLAAKNFINMDDKKMAEQVQDSLEGNMREVIGSMSLKDINIDRDRFSDEIAKKASPDMAKLGLEILSCNIQNVVDDNGLIVDLGADNTFAIKKTAAITKANAEKEIAQAQAIARKEANDTEVASEQSIAERQQQLALKKAELKIEQDTRQADADMAYAIQQQIQQAVVNRETINAKIEQTKREQELTAEQVRIRENELRATVNKEADALKYQTEVDAAAELEKQKRAAEANAYAAEMDAKAEIARAEAKRTAMILEAEGIKAQGEAEAYAIQQKGLAEAEAMQKKAEAFEKYGKAAITDMVVKVLPDMARATAEPIKAIDNLSIYASDGNGVTNVTNSVPVVLKQTFDVVKDATGVDMSEIIKNNQRIKIDDDSQVTVKK
ncbi:MAG: flotillin family protein [Bacteroidales bacterium]|jgi:flotillin|nr:flotillin family protein [Bacteroidota bacterium]MBQ9509498.1 flotillin family protein [Bacteroidales bacterium]MBR6064049.1 flotillin family protein [Bacteroidales bacterium]